MPSKEAIKLIHTIIDVLQELRESTLVPDARTGQSEKPISLRQLATKSQLDVAALSLAEEKERIPSFAFFVDWATALETDIESIVQQARAKIAQDYES